jgi:SAM-dependent methyltransferase
MNRPPLPWGLRAAAGLVLGCLTLACASAPPPEASVKPGINQDYLDPALNVDAMVQRFEVESREIYVAREAIAAAVRLEAGQAVADVGAGTGLFLEPFARAVGPAGRLYCVDIAPGFVAHLTERAEALGLGQVEAVLCSERSVELPERSIDVAFLCDTYHHFEYPRSTLASIRRALRPGGRLVLIDFERIPGVSRPWLLEHVRAGREQVLEEVQSAGFVLERQEQIPGLVENYCLHFVRP